MARGRMLNRKVSTSAKVAAYIDEYGAWAGIFHHRLIAWLDVNGCCRADPYWLKANVVPRLSGVTPEDCRTFAAGLERHGLAVLYEAEGMPYLHMPGFRDEQVGLRRDRENPEYPVPEGFDETAGRMPEAFRKPSGYAPEAVRKPAGENPAEDEGEGEVEGKDATPSLPSVATGSVQSAAELSTNDVESGPDPPRSLRDIDDVDDREAAYLQHGMPILRDEGFATKGREGDTNGSIVKALARKRIDPDAIERAIRGLRCMADAGRFDDSVTTLLPIYARPQRDGESGARRPLWREAEDAYLASLERDGTTSRGGDPERLRVEAGNG